MGTFEEIKITVDDFISESFSWMKNNKLTELPDYSELRDKVILGEHYTSDIIYYEKLTDIKSTLYGLIAYFTKAQNTASREDKRKHENMIDFLQAKSKELDTKLEAAKHRLAFYKTITYMIGNVLYGAD